MPDVGRTPPLIVDDCDLVALGAESKHRADEVVPGRAEEPGRADDPRVLAGRSLAVELRAAVGRERRRSVGLDVWLLLRAVEDVVGRKDDERGTELRRVRDAADVDRGRLLRLVLGAVDVGPRSRMQDEVGPKTGGRGQRDVPVRVAQGHELVPRERLPERAAELAARPGDQDATAASRAERIGVAVDHSSLTRGSSHGIPRSSGSAGSYSSVTW